MSKDLDKQIKQILTKNEYKGIEPAIEAIKQAFIADGWVQIPQVEVVTRWEAGSKPEVFMVNGKEVMTGEELYQRVNDEINHMIDTWTPFDRPMGLRDFLEAAKRASGVKR